VCGGTLAGRLAGVVRKLGGRIETVGPDNRACFVVNADLPEVLEVAQLFAEGPTQQERTIDIPNHSVAERHAQTVSVKALNIGDPKHRHMLRQRLDRDQWLQCLGAHPVVRELVRMQARH